MPVIAFHGKAAAATHHRKGEFPAPSIAKKMENNALPPSVAPSIPSMPPHYANTVTFYSASLAVPVYVPVYRYQAVNGMLSYPHNQPSPTTLTFIKVSPIPFLSHHHHYLRL